MNRIVVSKNGSGFFNLAADEYLLELHRRGDLSGVTLYFFVNSNAVIIGRNQNAWRECGTEAMERDGVQLVRRHTGGGAVYHDDGNLNFSFITNERLYDKDRLNRVVIEALASLGVKAELTGRNDVTVGGYKISGCAYALSGTARGMHGTLLVNTDMTRLANYLKPSALKLRAKGVSSVRARVMNLADIVLVTVDQVREAIADSFRREYGDCCEVFEVRSAEDVVRVYESGSMESHEHTMDELLKKQSSWEWRMGSSPVFDSEITGRLGFGEFQLLLRVKNGVIRSYDFYSDSMDANIPRELEGLLEGVRFEREPIADALERGGGAAKEIADFIRNGGESAVLGEAGTGLIKELRHALHACPELSGEERRTAETLKAFLREHTTLELRDMGRWFYAAHREGAGETVAVRADFDAVDAAGEARHLCGHDGHSAALAGLALMLEGRKVGRNVILLFQHAEETGIGAKECCRIFEAEKIDAIIGCHNIPGEPMGRLLFKRGAFACASCGLETAMHGAPTHAAYPENGADPTPQLARLSLLIPEIAEEISKKYSCMTLSTNIGLMAGSRAFGVAASDGALLVTLRSERTEALEELVNRAKETAERLASEHGLGLETTIHDPFPATVNDDALLDQIIDRCRSELIPFGMLDAPFRWSEDFGHYAGYVPAVFFGVGSGENTAPLHTEGFEYPDQLLKTAAETLYKLLK